LTCSSSQNLDNQGECYKLRYMPTILGQFRVGLLPYRVGNQLTEHVNPDKLHHYLNAGLEVVACPIPAARRLERYLHLATTSGDWATVLRNLRETRLQGSWPRESNTWDRRWAELVSLVLPGQPRVDRHLNTQQLSDRACLDDKRLAIEQCYLRKAITITSPRRWRAR
jgi:hypothetical protein